MIVPEVKAAKKTLDKTQASYESAQAKVAALRKKDKTGPKVDEAETALENEKVCSSCIYRDNEVDNE